METQSLITPGAFILRPRWFVDERGAFAETLRLSAFEARGLAPRFVQENLSRSTKRGTVRGLHFQIAPEPQAKLIRVEQGEIIDIIVDLREGSETYGRAELVELDSTSMAQLFVPAGLAHGFCTLTDECVVSYKLTGYYTPSLERGLNVLDPQLNIDLPFPVDNLTINARDREWPGLADVRSGFAFSAAGI